MKILICIVSLLTTAAVFGQGYGFGMQPTVQSAGINFNGNGGTNLGRLQVLATGTVSIPYTNHIVGKSYALMAQNTTGFFAPQGNAVTNIITSDTDMQTRQALGTGFKIVGVWVKSSAAAGAGQSYTFTVMTNGVATAVVGTISGASATTASDFAHGTVANAQGDSIGVKIVSSATAATNQRFDWDVMYINQ